MNVIINGKPRALPDGCTVRALLGTLGLDRAPCAVEVNADLVPRHDHDHRELREGDAVEVVTLVGGG